MFEIRELFSDDINTYTRKIDAASRAYVCTGDHDFLETYEQYIAELEVLKDALKRIELHLMSRLKEYK